MIGEKIRQAVDLEHWAAFQDGFRRWPSGSSRWPAASAVPAPGTITFLSGDVHNSYVAEVERRYESRIVQAVCSPIRNPLPYAVRYMTGFSAKNVGRRIGTFLARRAKVPPAPLEWKTVRRPVVRQQPGDAGDRRPQPSDAVGPRRRARRQGQRPRARTRRRGRDRN